MRAEPPTGQQLEDGERVVELIVAQPVVAVVPRADSLPVQARQFRLRTLGPEIRVRVPADGRVTRVERDVGEVVEVVEVVEVGKQAHLGEPAHPGDEAQFNVGVVVLERAVQPGQVVAVGDLEVRVSRSRRGLACRTRPPAPPRASLPCGAAPPAGVRVARAQWLLRKPPPRFALDVRHLLRHARASNSPGLLKLPLPKLSRTTGWRFDQFHPSWTAKPLNSSSLPSNSSLSVSTNRLVPKRRGRDRKVVLAGVVREPAGKAGLVHVVEAFLAYLPEGLDANRKSALGGDVNRLRHECPRRSRSFGLCNQRESSRAHGTTFRVMR